MTTPKRRLTVFKDDGASEEFPRPPWQWIGFGAVAIFTVWLPLAYPATMIAGRVLAVYAQGATPEEVARSLASAPPGEILKLEIAVRLLLALPLAIAAFAGGYLVGRWGRNVGVREAALAGLTTGLVTCALSWARVGFSWAPIAGIALAAPMAAWGGAAGLRTLRSRGGGA